MEIKRGELEREEGGGGGGGSVGQCVGANLLLLTLLHLARTVEPSTLCVAKPPQVLKLFPLPFAAPFQRDERLNKLTAKEPGQRKR